MAVRVKGWLAEGREVRIFTARVAPLFQPNVTKAERMVAQKAQWAIEDWCAYHFGEKLPVTAVKDFGMALLYDDRCVPVETDTGRVLLDEPNIQEASPPVPALVPAGEYPDTRLWTRVTAPMRHLLRIGSAVLALPSGGRVTGE
jgi:hypothetical protein